jgi:hypothetical protein
MEDLIWKEIKNEFHPQESCEVLAEQALKPDNFGKEVTYGSDNAVEKYNHDFNCPICKDFL